MILNQIAAVWLPHFDCHFHIFWLLLSHLLVAAFNFGCRLCWLWVCSLWLVFRGNIKINKLFFFFGPRQHYFCPYDQNRQNSIMSSCWQVKSTSHLATFNLIRICNFPQSFLYRDWRVMWLWVVDQLMVEYFELFALLVLTVRSDVACSLVDN